MKISVSKIWSKAKKIIPGGNGLLSKRPERFSNKYWPTYFLKANGINNIENGGGLVEIKARLNALKNIKSKSF